MIILDLFDRPLEPMTQFQSALAASTELAAGSGEAHTHVVALSPLGAIGRHAAGFGQLFVCLDGEGWVASADDVRVPLRRGQAAYFARGEQHSKGSDAGMRALIVQVRDLHVAAPRPDRRPAAAPVNVRAYEPRDLAEWLRMRRTLWPELAGTDEMDDAAAWLARPDAVVIVAERLGGGLSGFAELGARPYADGCDTSPVAFLEGWYVDEDVRRQGVATALLDAGEAWARSRGYSELASDALLDNTASHRPHSALGFSEVERAVRYRKPL